MPGPFLVRKAKALADGDDDVTGDGPGSENAVPIEGMNQVVLLIDGKQGSNSPALDLWMEVSVNGTDYYRETHVTDAASSTVSKRTYQIPNGEFSSPAADDRFAVAVDVMASFARFTFEVPTASADLVNLACKALTGRV